MILVYVIETCLQWNFFRRDVTGLQIRRQSLKYIVHVYAGGFAEPICFATTTSIFHQAALT